MFQASQNIHAAIQYASQFFITMDALETCGKSGWKDKRRLTLRASRYLLAGPKPDPHVEFFNLAKVINLRKVK